MSDIGGSVVLIHRYLYDPYRAGAFTKGTKGRTLALIKGAAAAAATVKLLKNASLNAQANPTLCKTVAAPLAKLTSTLSGLAGSLTHGSLDTAALSGLGGAASGLLGAAGSGGVAVTPAAGS